MKINISIEATPEEVRELLGIPNVGVSQNEFLKQMGENAKNGSIDPQAIANAIEPTLQFGQQFIDALSQSISESITPPNQDKKKKSE